MLLLVALFAVISTLLVILLAKCWQRDQKRKVAVHALAQVHAKLNTLPQLRYCVEQRTCEHCRRSKRPEDCDKCLIIRCREGSGCSNEACPDKSRHHPAECPICLEDFRDGDALRVLPCSHIFHSVCADKWLAHPEVSTLAERTCPMCKTLVFRVAAHDTDGTVPLAAHGTRGTNHGSAV